MTLLLVDILSILRFPVPARTSRVVIYKPLSSIVEAEYNLALYERVIQVLVLLHCTVVEDTVSIHCPVYFIHCQELCCCRMSCAAG